jgi:hypothetical protein
MRRRLVIAAFAASLCASAFGCKYDDPFEDDLLFMAPVSTRAAITWVEQTRHEIVFVTPADDDVELRRVPVGDERTEIAWTVPTLDGDRLLALQVPASLKHEDIDEELLILSADGSGEPQSIRVGAPFSAVALSPDRRRAVLYFGVDTGSGLLQNANQVAIVPLDGTEPLRTLTLNGFGGQVSKIEFPGQVPGQPGGVSIGGRVRDIAAFLAASEIVLVDMSDAAANQVAVDIGQVTFSPEATLLRPGNDKFQNPVLFLRSQYSSDVAMLTLVPKPGEEGFTTQVSLLPIGTQASDFVTHDGAEIPYLVSVDPSRQAIVFTDIRTQQGFDVSLQGSASSLFQRVHDDGGGSPTRQLVAWAPGGSLIHTLDLDGIEHALGRTPRRLNIRTGIDSLVILDNDRVLVGSGTNLYVVDFTLEQVTPLSSASPYDPRSSALEGNRLLLGTAGQSWISTVDLATLNPESMLLDTAIASFHHLPDAGKIVVVHDDRVGHVTVADAAGPSRSTSYLAWGFLYADMLDRP